MVHPRLVGPARLVLASRTVHWRHGLHRMMRLRIRGVSRPFRDLVLITVSHDMGVSMLTARGGRGGRRLVVAGVIWTTGIHCIFVQGLRTKGD